MKQRKKRDLPTKVCPVCNRPFSWRKKWEKNWDEVIYCSERCRSEGRGNNKIQHTK
ncbi:DUF2256 domain-containing protein [Catalinimonas niigatensis]|uniref:DUF2256 domain-containing protein n=1 Tax=Catalinimonas niigatensis TaxID=1397264 RepID=UPI00266665E6|nr:DUF2256 domain-containing protein [Catalinimonas niigatensis]WPP49008.1 DUF2256 domain-containing protein [Catalinimonas niigatensis]